MRLLFVLMILLFSIPVKAQYFLPGTYRNQLQQQSLAENIRLRDSSPEKKWFISKSIGISSSYAFSKGGSAAILAVPIGIQISRKLNNNWYAFAGISAAPAYTNFNHSFLSTNSNKFSSNNNQFKSNQLNMYSRAEMGLMYMNDQKTFSISGSISVEKSSYPLVPIQQMNTARPNGFIAPKNQAY